MRVGTKILCRHAYREIGINGLMCKETGCQCAYQMYCPIVSDYTNTEASRKCKAFHSVRESGADA